MTHCAASHNTKVKWVFRRDTQRAFAASQANCATAHCTTSTQLMACIRNILLTGLTCLPETTASMPVALQTHMHSLQSHPDQKLEAITSLALHFLLAIPKPANHAIRFGSTPPAICAIGLTLTSHVHTITAECLWPSLPCDSSQFKVAIMKVCIIHQVVTVLLRPLC